MNKSIMILMILSVIAGVLLIGEFPRTPSTTSSPSKVNGDVIYTGHNFRVYGITDPKTGTEYLVNSNGGVGEEMIKNVVEFVGLSLLMIVMLTVVKFWWFGLMVPPLH